MTLDVVIPNYNGSALLKKNLPKVIEEVERYKGSIIIVDDGSEKSEFEELDEFVKKQDGKNIILLRNEKNLGFSSAVNRGVAESNADFVLLLNTDVVPENNFLESALKDLQSNENLFGVGIMDKSIEDQGTVLRGRGLASWKRGFLIHRKGEVDHPDTFWISGGSSLVRRELFEKLSGFDPLYNPFYWEDIDLSYRARKSGYDVMFESKSVVEHRHEEGAIKKHYNSGRINTIAYRNQFIFVWKNITDSKLLLSHFIWLPYHILRAALRLDKSFFFGLLSAVICIPKILKRRTQQARLYINGDQEIINS